MEYPDTAEGTLVVMVCRAKHLPNRRKLDKQSPYVLLRIGTTFKKTPLHFRAGQTPEWTHELRFQLTRDRKPLLKLDVLDETKGEPTPIGAAEIDCSTVFQDPAHLQDLGKYILDAWHDLTFNGRAAGKIYLEMTFYPSAPIVPPKVACAAILPELPAEMPQLAPASPHDGPGVIDDVFVSGEPPKKSIFRFLDPGQGKAEPKKKDGRFQKLRDRFMAREPILSIWVNDGRAKDDEDGVPEPLSPIGADSADTSGFDEWARPYERPRPYARPTSQPPPPPPHSAHRPAHLPPPHSESPTGYNVVSAAPPQLYAAHGRGNSVDSYMFADRPRAQARQLLPPVPLKVPGAFSVLTSPKRAGRKPPPELMSHLNASAPDTTLVPFSADTFGLDDADDALPTRVYHLGQQVKSLTVARDERHELNVHEIDPKYYAPTPTEHLNKKFRMQSGQLLAEDVAVQLNTDRTGYLGEGKWRVETKFSPSVFQRINDENVGEENKPPVPPKIPRGLTELEYYVVEKDSYLKDINGRRI